jgi:hypothetical protein
MMAGRQNLTPGGIFPNERHGPVFRSHPRAYAPEPPRFFWIFLEPWAHNEPHSTLETHSAPQRMKTAPSWSGPSEQNQERRWSFQVGTPLLVHLWRYLSIVFLMAAFQSSRRWP